MVVVILPINPSKPLKGCIYTTATYQTADAGSDDPIEKACPGPAITSI